MPVDKDLVKNIAHLARIELSQKELEKLSRQFQDILCFIDKLTAADIKDTKPTSHILTVSNILREDSSGVSLPAGEALKNAPVKEAGFFGVPKVIE